MYVNMQAAAHPNDWNEEQGCTVPTSGHGDHGSPVPSPYITFYLKDASGQLVTAWKAGQTYTLSTAAGAADHCLVLAT